MKVTKEEKISERAVRSGVYTAEQLATAEAVYARYAAAYAAQARRHANIWSLPIAKAFWPQEDV